MLHLPDSKGRFHSYLDTSTFATGSALYQIQHGKLKLIAYSSKRLPKTAKHYSITELEMCGLAINIASFAHLLKRVDFDAIVHHLALMHIIKSKVELTTNRIKRLLEILSSYSFNLYYRKGKDMILSDFLSRPKHDDSNPHEIIPISFNMQNILHSNYYNIGNYFAQTRSQVKSSGICLPEVHGIGKVLDPNIRPEKQIKKTIIPSEVKGISQIKPRLGQGRGGLRWKIELPMSPLIDKPIVKLTEKPILHMQHTKKAEITLKVPLSKILVVMTKLLQYQIMQFLKQDPEMIKILHWSKE